MAILRRLGVVVVLVAGKRYGPDQAGSRARFDDCQRQWLVPADSRVLFHTLYLPTGRFMGRRLTSFRVFAS